MNLKQKEIQKSCMAELELEKKTLILRYKAHPLAVSTSLHGQRGLFIFFRIIYSVSRDTYYILS